MSSKSTQVAKMQYLNDGGNDILQSIGQGGNVQVCITTNGGVQVNLIPITASGAINPGIPGVYIVTLGSAAALTLAAPVVGVDDGNDITIISNTAFAHKVTATGILNTGTASVNSITFPAFAGAAVELVAYQGKWNVLGTGTGGTGTSAYTLG
jgi:hypothetical protein